MQRVFIRGSYASDGSQQTRLENVNLEFADEGTGNYSNKFYQLNDFIIITKPKQKL